MDYVKDQPNTPRNRGDYSAPHLTGVTPSEDMRTILLNRVSWGAVFSGVALAMVSQFILNLIGIGVGIAAIDPVLLGSEAAVASQITMGAVIWWTVSSIISAFVGGYTAGRLAGDPRESTSGWHGLTCWAASVVLLIMMVVAGAGAIVGGNLNSVGINVNGMQARMNTTGTVASGTYIGDQSAQIAQPGSRMTPAERADLISKGSLFSAIALLVGALAAWFGGRAATVKPTVTDVRLRREPLH